MQVIQDLHITEPSTPLPDPVETRPALELRESGWGAHIVFRLVRGVQAHPALLRELNSLLPDHHLRAHTFNDEIDISFFLPDNGANSRQLLDETAERASDVLPAAHIIEIGIQQYSDHGDPTSTTSRSKENGPPLHVAD